jgi:hypothetical protein
MHLLLFGIIGIAIERKCRNLKQIRNNYQLFVIIVIVAGALVYMGYIADARDDIRISQDRTSLLAKVFDFETSEIYDLLVNSLNPSFRSTVTETVVYFSSPIYLFSYFQKINLESYTLGAMTLPFIFRQFEPFTGMSVVSMLNQKIEAMQNTGVIGTGWTTTISSYIIDFGKFGAAIAMAVHGYLVSHSWRMLRSNPSFHNTAIAIVFLISIIYLPLVPVFSDTNIILLIAYTYLSQFRINRIARVSRYFQWKGGA